MERKLIFTSYGLTSSVGRRLIGKELAKDSTISNKRIFLFHEPYYSIEPILINACLQIGFKRENIILSGRQKTNEELSDIDYIYVTEGNTFEILSLLRERGLEEVIKKAFSNGATYIGASAGAMIAGTDVEEALNFDRNFVRTDDFMGLGLFDGMIIPHYTKAELKRYIKNSPGIEERYGMILSVANGRSLVMG